MDQLRKRRATGCKVIQTSGIDYGQEADAYSAHRRIHVAVFEALCASGKLGSASTVLEVGCGTGNYASALARRFGCVTCGLEPSAAMLQHARRQPGSVLWILGHAEQLGFADQAFDLIFSVDVIHHVPNKAAFFQQAARALRPGGRLYATTNGRAHMVELVNLVHRFDATLPYRLGEPNFSLDNGMEQLVPFFEQVEVRRYSDSLEIQDAQPIVAYVFSTLEAAAEVRAEFHRYVQRELDAGRGVIRIGKDLGLLVASVPA